MHGDIDQPRPVDPAELERRGWIAAAVRSGGDFFSEHMSEDAVAVLPGGVLTKDAVLGALASSEPWEEFHFSDERLIQPATDLRVFVYRARAKRAAQPWYEALIASVYVADEDQRWRLVCHQQTPLPSGGCPVEP